MDHAFQPKTYHTTIGTRKPVLRVAGGDRIITTTLDAHGVDRAGRKVAEQPNPQTGPFFVEDAAPGDTLVVCLEKIRPNRSHGFTSTTIAPNVLEPDHGGLTAEADRIDWAIDLESNTATLDLQDAKLAPLSVPLRPMLGCFGVAPPGEQAISCDTSGRYGGNMDYRGFVAGVTVYLPVFVEGALLYLGDGHAWQGDGEILGAGIEVSMDVEVTVRVMKGKSIGWPRGESEDAIFTVGNARPLDQAAQHATSEMLRWLQTDYELEDRSAQVLLGTFVEYDVGNFFDPAYTMVCKLSKRMLSATIR
jgi:acetamidase/formamidase